MEIVLIRKGFEGRPSQDTLTSVFSSIIHAFGVTSSNLGKDETVRLQFSTQSGIYVRYENVYTTQAERRQGYGIGLCWIDEVPCRLIR
jgi:hypothetical protein